MNVWYKPKINETNPFCFNLFKWIIINDTLAAATTKITEAHASKWLNEFAENPFKYST